MNPYTHVSALYQVARTVEKFGIEGPVKYRGTTKLHGANAGVACFRSNLVPQSRNRTLSVDSDHMGFASFVAEHEGFVRALEQDIRSSHGVGEDSKLVLFGEWIGPGIQNGMATNSLPKRQWVLFASMVVDEESRYIDAIGPLENAHESIHSVYDAPTWDVEIDFSCEDSKAAAIEATDRITANVEAYCPWGRRFGVKGLGEGVVWIPVGSYWGRPELYWKSKGSRHKEVKKSKRNLPSLAPEVIESVERFVDFAVTEARLAKGIDYLVEMGHGIEMSSTGNFLKWINEDIERECALELAANDLQWKQVSKSVGKKAKDYFVNRVKAL